MAEALAAGRSRLAQASDSPRLDAELLLSQVLNVSRGVLAAKAHAALETPQQQAFEVLLQRREQGEPVAYLLGSKGFWTLDLLVNADVLVPRPETELLVEWSLALFPAGADRVADLGTGSGALALAIASEWPRAQVLATDVSDAALDVARRNAQSCGIGNVSFVQGSWCQALTGRFDLIVSNPPYIAAGDAHLPALRHEPIDALSDGGDGLGCLREIIACAPVYLAPSGWLLLEHGFDQATEVRHLLTAAGFAEVQTRRDLSGHERASGGRWPA